MSDKANFLVNGKEVTVLYEVHDDTGKKPCHYCSDLGHRQIVSIKSICVSSELIEVDTSLYRAAKLKLSRGLLHGRPICRIGSNCEQRYVDDRSKKASDRKIFLS